MRVIDFVFGFYESLNMVVCLIIQGVARAKGWQRIGWGTSRAKWRFRIFSFLAVRNSEHTALWTHWKYAAEEGGGERERGGEAKRGGAWEEEGSGAGYAFLFLDHSKIAVRSLLNLVVTLYSWRFRILVGKQILASDIWERERKYSPAGGDIYMQYFALNFTNKMSACGFLGNYHMNWQ